MKKNKCVSCEEVKDLMAAEINNKEIKLCRVHAKIEGVLIN